MPVLPPLARRLLGGAAFVMLLVVVAGPSGQRGAIASALGGGALVAAVALGVVLTHRSSGVVNFANGATATYAAYAFTGLRRGGRLFLPPLPNPLALVEGALHAFGASGVVLPHVPTSLSLGGPQPFGVALALSLLVASLMGVLIHLLVFRPLRHAPPLAKTVASIGLLLVLQAVVVLRYGAQTLPVKPLFKKLPVHLLGVAFASDQLILAGLVVAATAVLWALFRFTRFGLATRAAAEDEKGAVLIGLEPERLAAANWVLSAVLAAGFGILAATVNASLDPSTITLLIIPALGAALVGGLSSFGVTVGAAFAISCAQGVLQFLAATKSWFPKAGGAPLPGLKEALPLLVILVVLFVRGDRLPTRGALSVGRLPLAPTPTGIMGKAVVGAAVGITGLLVVGPDWRLAAINTLVGIVICLSLVVLTGFVGQISLAQMAFAGIGGFAVSKLATSIGIGFPIGPLVGALAATVIGLIAAVPALRVRGVNLAIVTLAAAAAVENLVFKNPALSRSGAPVPSPSLFGFKFGPNDATSLSDGKLPSPLFGIFCLAVVIVLAVLVANLRRSVTGRQMLAVRTNERAAAGAGISVARAKLLAFALSSFIAGLAGALSAYRFGSVSAATFGSFTSIAFLAFAYLGGISSVAGAVVGGMLVAGGIGFTALHQWTGIDPALTNLLGGLGLILTAILHPEGVAGGLIQMRRLATSLARRLVGPAQMPVAIRTDEGVAI
jgi:branched-chain amino acid transport system permease protein